MVKCVIFPITYHQRRYKLAYITYFSFNKALMIWLCFSFRYKLKLQIMKNITETFSSDVLCSERNIQVTGMFCSLFLYAFENVNLAVRGKWVPVTTARRVLRLCGWTNGFQYGGQLRIYWISSRGQPTPGGRPAWGLGEVLMNPYRVNVSVMKWTDTENRALRRIFGSKSDVVTGEWRKLHIKDVNDL